jgi:hypothetical protein
VKDGERGRIESGRKRKEREIHTQKKNREGREREIEKNRKR